MAADKPQRRLIVAIHDVSPRSEGAVEDLRAALARHVPVNKVAMLVIPNHWGDSPIVAGSAFASRLRGWADSGGEIFVHGWFHRDHAEHEALVDRLKARFMTANEGEFLGLDEPASERLMTEGQTLIEDIIGRSVAGFVAPAWLYGPGALRALSKSGFEMAEDHFRVWRPASGEVLCRGPVITWASRNAWRLESSLLCARLLPELLRSAPCIRVAVHPADAQVPELLRSIDLTVGQLARLRSPARYSELMT